MPTDIALLERLIIEPLDRKKHDRAAFSSGEDRIDTYLKTRAAGLMDVDGTVARVACLPDTGEIVGFYAMNAHAIEAGDIPAGLRKRLPRDLPIGATFLSNIAVATAYQRKGVASYLLGDAFERAVLAAAYVSSAFIVLDALTPEVASLYRRHGFINASPPEGRMIISMKAVRAAVAAASTVDA